jgi:hypothetical protein
MTSRSTTRLYELVESNKLVDSQVRTHRLVDRLIIQYEPSVVQLKAKHRCQKSMCSAVEPFLRTPISAPNHISS